MFLDSNMVTSPMAVVHIFIQLPQQNKLSQRHTYICLLCTKRYTIPPKLPLRMLQTIHTLMRRCVCLRVDGSLIVLVDGPFAKIYGTQRENIWGRKAFRKILWTSLISRKTRVFNEFFCKTKDRR